MRKILAVAFVLVALGCFAGAGQAIAGGCGKCASKCGCEAKCSKPKCKSKCGCPKKTKGCCTDCCARTPHNDWGGGVWWNGDACCPPDLDAQEVCLGEECGCHKARHPYERCWNGSGMLCDTGCSAFIPCKRKCVTCTTVCKEVKCKDECGCEHVSYEHETVCTEITRPRTIPWWFNPKAGGNKYLDENGSEIGEVKAEAEDAGWAADQETVSPGKA